MGRTAISDIISKVKNDRRSRIVWSNAIASGVMKSCSLLCSFIMVPLTINYLNPENYGIWMAITSILYWFIFMDVGLGNGMRNYLAIYFSQNNIAKARSCFATSMLLLSIIAILIGVIAIPAIYIFDFNYIFSAHHISNATLSFVLLIAMVLSLIQFVIKNIGLVYVAMQKYAIYDLMIFLGNIFSVIVIYILTKTTDGSLPAVVTTITGIPVIIFILSAIFMFKRHPELRPSRSCIDMNIGKDIVSKGLGFFIIQITSCLIIFGSANILISHYCGPEQVTIYNVSYKLFNVLVIGYTILISPMWNAYTDAAVKGDWEWIRKCFRKSLLLCLLSFIAGAGILVFSDSIFFIWVGESVRIPFEVSASVLLYISAFNLNNCTTYLINGLNKIRIQIITSLVTTALYLIAIYVIKGSYGILGISLSMAAAYLLMSMIHLYQCRLFVRQKATGIWNK